MKKTPRKKSAKASKQSKSRPSARAREPKRGASSRSKPTSRARSSPSTKSKPATRKKPNAARSSARKLAAARIAESIAASEREAARARGKRSKAAKKGAKTRARNRSARGKRGEIEAKIVAAGPKAIDAYSQLYSALERMADTSPYALSLSLEASPEEGKTPWLLVGVFRPRAPLDYSQLSEVFSTWEADLILETTIHPSRAAWIRWNYRVRGKVAGFAPGGIGEWNKVISEARQSCDPDIEDSLASKYDGEIGMPDDEQNGGIQVYLSAQVLRGPALSLTQYLGRR